MNIVNSTSEVKQKIM